MDESLAKIRHDRSVKDFPKLRLEEDEYVEYAFSRARICLIMILLATAAALIFVLVAFLFTLLAQDSLDEMGRNFIIIILFAILATALIAGMIAIMVYNGNKLFVTNKRVIQMIMNSPVSKSINTIDLPSIEDASYHQHGLLQTFLNYGTLRLATVGDETTYTFKYSDISPEHLKGVSDLITTAKKRYGLQMRRRASTDTSADTSTDAEPSNP